MFYNFSMYVFTFSKINNSHVHGKDKAYFLHEIRIKLNGIHYRWLNLFLNAVATVRSLPLSLSPLQLAPSLNSKLKLKIQ